MEKNFKDMVEFKKLYESARIISSIEAGVEIGMYVKDESAKTCVTTLYDLLLKNIMGVCIGLRPLQKDKGDALYKEIHNILSIVMYAVEVNCIRRAKNNVSEVGTVEFLEYEKRYEEKMKRVHKKTQDIVDELSSLFVELTVEE